MKTTKFSKAQVNYRKYQRKILSRLNRRIAKRDVKQERI